MPILDTSDGSEVPTNIPTHHVSRWWICATLTMGIGASGYKTECLSVYYIVDTVFGEYQANGT